MSSSSLAELFGISSEDVANKKKGAKGKGSGKTFRRCRVFFAPVSCNVHGAARIYALWKAGGIIDGVPDRKSVV